MENIHLTFRYNDAKVDCTTEDLNIILGDLVSQISGQDPRIPAPSPDYFYVKGDTEAQLALNRTLAENGIQDNDVIYVTRPGKAG